MQNFAEVSKKNWSSCPFFLFRSSCPSPSTKELHGQSDETLIALPQDYLFPLGRLLQLEQGDVVNEGRVVESRMDQDLRDVDLLMPERFRRCADVVLAEPDLQDVADVGREGKAENRKKSQSLISKFFVVDALNKCCNEVQFTRSKNSE